MTIPKSKSAYEHIKEMILTGELPPEADISEKELQEKLGCSRTPVREALQRLQEENFVKTYPRKGTIVTDVTMDTVKDLYSTRLLLEPAITRDAVHTASRAWMEDLRRRMMVEHTFQSREDIHAVMALDTELHTVVASCCSNAFLRDALRLVYEHDRRIRLKTDRNPQQVKFSQKEHVEILDAMLAGDEALTERLARRHIIHSRDLTYESLHLRKSGLIR